MQETAGYLYYILLGALSTSIPGPHGKIDNLICPQQPIAESITCRSARWLRWRIMFEDSLALSDITMEYIPTDPVGRTHEATGNGLSFTFNLIFNNQSQLVSVMTVTRQINNSTVNITVHCGQDIHHLSWIAVQGEYSYITFSVRCSGTRTLLLYRSSCASISNNH
jgi:hypothetical protein